MARVWRKPTEDDKKRERCYAVCHQEKKKFYVSWNREWDTWSLHGYPHILVRVDEILEPK